MYILVNKDLEMSKGKISDQVGHVVCDYVGSFVEGVFPSREDWINYKQWKREGQKKIILQAHQGLMEELEKDSKYFAIRDFGLTETPSNSLSVICLGVETKAKFYEEVPKLKKLRLL